MGRILENWRVVVAVLFSAVLVVGAYVIADSVKSPPIVQASDESELLQAIATRDSDNDGLNDWEEALYGTSANNSDSLNLGMTDGDAVSRGLIVPKAIADISIDTSSSSLDSDGLPPAPAYDTITSAFAKNLFSLYLEAKQANGGVELTDSDVTDITNKAISALSSSITISPDFKSASDLTVSGSGPEALKTFAESAEAVFAKNTNNATTSEINYLKYAIENNDTDAISYIISIAKSYRNSATGLAVLKVPTELANVDLALINAMARISEIINDFAREATDPMATMLAIGQYPSAVLALENAFIDIGKIYKTAGISISAGTPGASFVNLMSDIANQESVVEKS